jgi:NAD(P)-dependent dehydrogenase (short-subunit alcohol dehydrogenase family)
MNERNDMQAKLGTTDRRHTILIIGISRGIGRGLAAEYLRRGWFVIGTVRSSTVAPELEAMAAGMAGRLRVERLDMTQAVGDRHAARATGRRSSRRPDRQRGHL